MRPAPSPIRPIAALLALAIVLVASPASGHRVRLHAAIEVDPVTAPGADAAPRAAPRSLLVHYGDADPASARSAIEAAGGRVVSYIAERSYLVRLPAGATIAAGGPLQWIGDYRPAYSLAPALRTLDPGATADVDVLLFPDAALDGVISGLPAGSVVLAVSENRTNRILRARVAGAAIAALAGINGVRWIEPVTRPRIANQQVQWTVQGGVSEQRPLWVQGLDGSGQFVGITDTGIHVAHPMFEDPTLPIVDFADLAGHRKVVAYYKGSNNPNVTFGDHAAAEFHGTHVAATIAGNDDGLGTSALDGVAPDARIFFQDLSGPALIDGVDPFPDLNDLFEPLWSGSGSGTPHVCCNAWGHPADGAYTLDAMEVDQFMWGHDDFLVLFPSGDGGAGTRVYSPASAKNCLSVGATGNGAGAETTLDGLGSTGPADDGRRKPTLVAPGIDIVSARADPQPYTSYSGSSAAVAAATGAALLIRQYCADGWYPTRVPQTANELFPSAALLKAMCVASADRTVAGHAAPDDTIGFGRIDAANVCLLPGDPRSLLLVDETNALAQGGFREYPIVLGNGERPLTGVLCWTDAPGDPAAAVQLVNDLDLTLRRGSEIYKGNVFSGGWSAAGGSRDDRNVEETVALAAPGPGTWTLRVDATSVPVGTQRFGICVVYDDTPVASVPPPPAAFAFSLRGAHPARGAVTFELELPEPRTVTLEVFDATGRRVSEVLNGTLPAGRHPVRWNAGAGNEAIRPGVYLARVTAGAERRVRRLVLLSSPTLR
jgi:hypothetical protein